MLPAPTLGGGSHATDARVLAAGPVQARRPRAPPRRIPRSRRRGPGSSRNLPMAAIPVGTPNMSQAAVVEKATDSSSRVMQLPRRHPLISFFVMAYAISWAYVIVFLIVWPLPDTIVTDTPELLGPVVAGFVMTAVMSGRAGVRQLLRRFVMWRVRAVWYLYALVAIPALYFIGVMLVPGALGSFKVPSLTASLLYPVLFLVVLVLDGPLLEEPGWRGFALPRLQTHWGPLLGTVILGVMWAGWHAPQYFTKTF